MPEVRTLPALLTEGDELSSVLLNSRLRQTGPCLTCIASTWGDSPLSAFQIIKKKEGGIMVIITTRVRQMNDIVKTFEDGPESVQEILWSEGPWPRLGEELEKAWKNYYEVQGYSPFATCGNDQSRSKDFCVLTSAALPFTSPCSPMHASFTPSTPDSQVPGVDSSYSPLQQLRGGVSPSGGQPYGIVQISSVC